MELLKHSNNKLNCYTTFPLASANAHNSSSAHPFVPSPGPNKVFFLSYFCFQFNKLTSVFHASVSVIDHEFRHNIVKVAEDPRGDNRVDPQTTLAML